MRQSTNRFDLGALIEDVPREGLRRGHAGTVADHLALPGPSRLKKGS